MYQLCVMDLYGSSNSSSGLSVHDLINLVSVRGRTLNVVLGVSQKLSCRVIPITKASESGTTTRVVRKHATTNTSEL